MNAVANLTNRLGAAAPGGAARWQLWLPVLVTYALLVLLAWLAANLAWRVVDLVLDSTEVAPASIVADARPEEAKGTALSAVVWKTFQLFGAEPDASKPVVAPAPAKPVAPPPEPVKVTLHGTIASTDPAGSLAVLSVKGAPAEIFRVGDEVQTGVTLKSVDVRSILLAAGGEDILVALEENSGSRRAVDTSLPAPLPTPALPGDERVSAPDVVKKLENYRATLSTNPLSLMDKIRIYPVERDGAAYGVRVRPGTDRALLGQVGLRSGDIVTSINGVSVSDVANLSDVIAQLRDQPEIRVQFERGGQPQEMNLVLDNSGAR